MEKIQETKKNVPRCVGIIMDGNRRWAKSKGLPTFEGHRRGYEKFKELVEWAKKAGIQYLIVYAFSTENWNRSKEEVGYLMDLFRVLYSKDILAFKKCGVRIRCMGERERFAPDIQNMAKQVEDETKHCQELTLVLAMSYGGRAEILQAVKKAIENSPAELTEKTFGEFLWTKDIPDPDLIIRTSGEMRLSGFLPWQAVYSELFFTKTLWPDFSEEEFKKILAEFAGRERRNGK